MIVSIITATYNSANTVRDTLDSVAGQTYSNIEHIIVDGCSKDGTLEIVKEYPHVAKVVSEKDKGIYDAMNKGIGLATGEIIGILNSDDFYASELVLEKVVNTILDRGVDTVYGDLSYVSEKNIAKTVRNWKANAYKKNSFLYGWMPPHPTFFVRREVYDKFGTFDLDLKSAADYELMLRFLYKNKVSAAYIPETLVHMRTGGQSNASIKNRLLANKEDRKAWEKNNLRPNFFTLYLKPIRKIGQFVKLS